MSNSSSTAVSISPEVKREENLRQRVPCRRPACRGTNNTTGSAGTLPVAEKEIGQANKDGDNGCCGESCLTILALRACHGTTDCSKSKILLDSSSSGSSSHVRPSSKLVSDIEKASCGNHLNLITQKYGKILEDLGCICRSILERGDESCCYNAAGNASTRSRSPQGSVTSKNVKEVKCEKKGCCGSGVVDDASIRSRSPGDLVKEMEKGKDKMIELCKGTEDSKSLNSCNTSKPPNAGMSGVMNDKHNDGKGSSDGCCGGNEEKASKLVEESCLSTKRKICREEGTIGKEIDDQTMKDGGCCGQEPSPTVPLKKAKDIDDCEGKDCCNSKRTSIAAKDDDCCASKVPRPRPTPRVTVSQTDCSKKACCGSQPVFEAPKIDDYSQKKCCSGKPSMPISPAIDNCSKKGCCDSKLAQVVAELDDCSKDDCCSKNTSPISIALDASKNDGCKKACCSNKIVDSTSCTESDTELSIEDAPLQNTPLARTTDLDVEKGLLPIEHLILSVQGMTCTGCEKKLFRSLVSLPVISNVKTSLVLAQAEFDLSVSKTTDSASMIKNIERMTGFVCTKMTQSGQELDLVVSSDVQDFDVEKLPFGVTDLKSLNKKTIRVTYQPKLIGARELLADPFFRPTQLAPLSSNPQITAGRAHVRDTFLGTILSALLTIPVLVLAWAPLPGHETLYGAISLVLATIVQIAIAGPFYTAALKALIFSRMIEMDLLIVISTTTAYIYSIIAYACQETGNPLSTGEFFETSTLLVTLIMVGRAVSAFARQRAIESISIESLQTPTALLIDPETDQMEEIDARLLQYQDVFKVLPDASIVTDGTVISGESEVDESMLTGEARLIAKEPGSPVVAGSINHSGALIVRLTRLPGENTIKTIGKMVDEAKSTKPKIQEIADRVASYFVPVIIAITILVFIIWVAIGKAVRNQSTTTACINAMTFAISVLVVSCPCAIGLAVPLVVVIAGGVAAKRGIIFKNAETIEIARNLSHVIFDKTGTLTQGKLSVEVEEYPLKDMDMIGPVILGLMTNSKHPISIAIATHLKAQGFSPSKVDSVVSIPGKGLEATYQGKAIRAGNPHWLGIEDSPSVQKVLSLGLTTFCITMDSILIAAFGLKDNLRPDALSTITQLKARGIEISILSGDNEAAVQSIASLLDIPSTHVRAHCTPADKQAYVKELTSSSSALSSSFLTKLKQHSQQKQKITLFCGDGTNDASALSQASIGLGISSSPSPSPSSSTNPSPLPSTPASSIPQSAADAILLRPTSSPTLLQGIITLIDLSKAHHQRVMFNFAWAGIYNTLAVGLAAGVVPKARIKPEFAGLGELVSVLPVVGGAVGLRWWRGGEGVRGR